MLTKFEVGQTYKNRIGEYTVQEFMEDGKHMAVLCHYDNKTRPFDILIAQLIIHNMRKENIYEENI